MNKFVNKLQMGSRFPEISSATLCFSQDEKISRFETEKIKKEIEDYLKAHTRAYISDLATVLNIEPRKVVLALKELKDEGIIT